MYGNGKAAPAYTFQANAHVGEGFLVEKK